MFGNKGSDLMSMYGGSAGGESLADKYSKDSSSDDSPLSSMFSTQASYLDGKRDIGDSFNVRGGNYGNMSVIDKMRGIQANRLNIDGGNVSIAEMYSDGALDTRVANGIYNNTISDIYSNKHLYDAYHGLNTDGHVEANENYLIDSDSMADGGGAHSQQNFILGTDNVAKEPGLLDKISSGRDEYNRIGEGMNQSSPDYGGPNMSPAGFGGPVISPMNHGGPSMTGPSYQRSTFNPSITGRSEEIKSIFSGSPNVGGPDIQPMDYSGGSGVSSSPFDIYGESLGQDGLPDYKDKDGGQKQGFMDKYKNEDGTQEEMGNVAILKQRLVNLKNTAAEERAKKKEMFQSQFDYSGDSEGGMDGFQGEGTTPQNAAPGQAGAVKPLSPGEKAKQEKEAKKETEKAIREATSAQANQSMKDAEAQAYIDSSFGGKEESSANNSGAQNGDNRSKSIDPETAIKKADSKATFNSAIGTLDATPEHIEKATETSSMNVKELIVSEREREKTESSSCGFLCSDEEFEITPEVQEQLDTFYVKKGIDFKDGTKLTPPEYSEKNIPKTAVEKDLVKEGGDENKLKEAAGDVVAEAMASILGNSIESDAENFHALSREQLDTVFLGTPDDEDTDSVEEKLKKKKDSFGTMGFMENSAEDSSDSVQDEFSAEYFIDSIVNMSPALSQNEAETRLKNVALLNIQECKKLQSLLVKRENENREFEIKIVKKEMIRKLSKGGK